MAVSTRPGDFSPRAARTADATDRAAFYERWLRVWVAIIAIVVVVVVVFLIFISNALAGIDNNLGVTTSEVVNVGGNAKTLPAQINSVNKSLDAIYQDLAPVDGEAITIISNLATIENNLAATSSSLVSTAGLLHSTAGTLVTVSGSLSNTEGVLVAVNGLAGNINTSLDNTQQGNANCNVPVIGGVYTPPAGATKIGGYSCGGSSLNTTPQRLEVINNILNVVHTNLTDTSNGLTSVDGHLSSICNALVINVLKIVSGGTCP
ncbi:MAG: hypothetical protein ACRDX8_04860 [Acidimicrobiales bacterium]